MHGAIDWLIELRLYVPLDKIGHFGDVPKPTSWLGMEKAKSNTTKTRIHKSKQNNVLQHKINTRN